VIGGSGVAAYAGRRKETSIMKRLFIVLFFAVAAQAQDHPPLPTTPPEQLSALNATIGTWTATAQGMGAGVAAAPSTKVTFTRDLKDRFIRMEGSFIFHPNTKPVQIRAYYSYDRFQNVYRMAVLDDAAGLLDVYEGAMRKNEITLTNLRTGTFFGRDRIFGAIRFLNFSADGFDVELEGSNDEGRSWRTNTRIRFQRVR
jgi:Protein of unknown function (DUF1579)